MKGNWTLGMFPTADERKLDMFPTADEGKLDIDTSSFKTNIKTYLLNFS